MLPFSSTFLPFYFLLVLLLLSSVLILKDDHSKRLLTWVLLISPLGYFFYTLFANTVNVPFMDDYNLLDTFHRMLTADSSADRIKAFFEQVNEHRFAFERVLMAIIYGVFGSENIKAQIILGNCFSVGIVYFLYRFHRAENLPLAYFLPVPFLVFSLLYYENAIWGIAAIQNTPLIFFALLTAYGLSQPTQKGTILALLSAVTISFISGSGMSVWVIGILVLAFQKRYKSLLVWVVSAVSIIAFYFLFDYHVYTKDSSALLKFPIRNLMYLFAFWGNIFYADHTHFEYRPYYMDTMVCIGAGAVILAVSLLWFFRTATKKHTPWTFWFLSGAILFFMATGAMLVIGRPASEPIIHGGSAFSRRYVIFGTMLIACIYLAALRLLKGFHPNLSKGFAGLSILMAVVLNFLSYYLFLPKVRQFGEQLTLDHYYVSNEKILFSFGEKSDEKLFWNHPTFFLELLDKLRVSGIYELKPYPYQTLVTSMETRLDSVSGADQWPVHMDLRQEYEHGAATSRLVYITVEKPETTDDKLLSFVLKGNGKTFIVPVVQQPQSVGQMLATGRYYNSVYVTKFWETKFPAGTYELWYVREDGQKSVQFLPSRKKITI